MLGTKEKAFSCKADLVFTLKASQRAKGITNSEMSNNNHEENIMIDCTELDARDKSKSKLYEGSSLSNDDLLLMPAIEALEATSMNSKILDAQVVVKANGISEFTTLASLLENKFKDSNSCQTFMNQSEAQVEKDKENVKDKKDSSVPGEDAMLYIQDYLPNMVNRSFK